MSILQATDDDGKGQASVVSLRITLIDANDSPPVCESPLYRASLDEGATSFDPPLIIKARDLDTVSDINYKYAATWIIMFIILIYIIDFNYDYSIKLYN